MSAPVLHIVAGDLWGGKEAQIEAQLQAVRAAGWDARVLVFNGGEVRSRYDLAKIPVIVVNESRGFSLLLADAAEAAGRIRPRLIVAHGYKEMIVGWRLAAKLKIPWVAVYHGAREPYRGFTELKMRSYEILTHIVVRLFAARIVCVSHALGAKLGFSGLKRLRILYNTRTEAVSGAPDANLFPKRPAILVIGRLVRVKRIDRAIEIFRAVRQTDDATLYIAGDGPEEDLLKRAAGSSGVAESIRFLGFRKDGNELLAASDVVLISSDSEGIPTVLLDAIQSGVPIVSTAVGGIPEVMNFFPEYPATLLAPRDVAGLAAAVKYYLHKRPAAPESRHRVLSEVFSPERAAHNHESLYRELIHV